MDANDRLRKRRREARRERNRERALRGKETKQDIAVKRVLAKPAPKPMAPRPNTRPAYKLAPQTRNEKPKVIYDTRALTDALDQVRVASSRRLADRREALFADVPELPAHKRPDIKPLDPLPVQATKSAKLAEAFNDEPRSGSVHPREDKDPPTCKPRPKNNRPTGSGGGRKRKFVPWC